MSLNPDALLGVAARLAAPPPAKAAAAPVPATAAR
jgi:hypothetical protein